MMVSQNTPNFLTTPKHTTESIMKTDMNKEFLIDQMGETIFHRFADFMDQHDYETADCLHSEWNVDGIDPEDGNYEFLFMVDLTEV